MYIQKQEISREELLNFIIESNLIEGIIDLNKAKEEVGYYINILSLNNITLNDLKYFVIKITNAPIRDQEGMNVRVANHRPISGGLNVVSALHELLRDINKNSESPFKLHNAYETLHPFMDGNGRSGRMLWLYQMLSLGIYHPKLKFLHSWYYQSLSENRTNAIS